MAAREARSLNSHRGPIRARRFGGLASNAQDASNKGRKNPIKLSKKTTPLFNPVFQYLNYFPNFQIIIFKIIQLKPYNYTNLN